MMPYSLKSIDQIFAKGYGLLSFVTSRNTG